MFVCPNCDFQLAEKAKLCPNCKADFGAGSSWVPVYQDPPKPFAPNEVPLIERIGYLVFIVFGIADAAYGVYAGQVYIPAKRGGGSHIQGPGAWVLVVAILVGVANLVAHILDHYDRRDNERVYELFNTRTKYAFWGLYIIGLFMPSKWW